MSEHIGGHEIDAPNSRALFNVILGFSGITLVVLATCVQLFNKQRDSFVQEQAVSYRLHEYQAEMAKKTTTKGQTEIKTPDGKVLEVLKYVPLEQVKARMIRNPQMNLKAAPPPLGWIHPDDIASGTQTAKPAKTPEQNEVAKEGDA